MEQKIASYNGTNKTNKENKQEKIDINMPATLKGVSFQHIKNKYNIKKKNVDYQSHTIFINTMIL